MQVWNPCGGPSALKSFEDSISLTTNIYSEFGPNRMKQKGKSAWRKIIIIIIIIIITRSFTRGETLTDFQLVKVNFVNTLKIEIIL